MGIILAIVAFVSLYQSKFFYKTYNTNYVTQDSTKAINGIFVMLVFYCHFEQYVTLQNTIDLPFIFLNDYLGSLIVTTFLFYSGYAVMYQIIHKEGYLTYFLKKRILLTILHFDSAVVLYMLLNLVLYKQLNRADALFALVAWKSIGNSTWYVFAIILCWLFTYASFKLIKNYKMSAAITTGLVIAYAMVIMRIKPEHSWYNTVLCYPAGIWFCIYKKQIEHIVMCHNKCTWLASMSILFAAFIMAFLLCPISNVNAVLFVLTIVIFTMKVKIGNSFLNWLGSHVFSIYILQRLPMMLLKLMGIHEFPYIFFGVSVIITFMLAVFFDTFWKSMDKRILKQAA